MTHDELQAIKARAEAATPGPWTTESYGNDGRDDVEIQHVRGSNGRTVVTTDCNVYTTDEDATFIAHARTDVPALVAEVERLQKVHADLEAENRRLRQQHDRDWEINADLRQEIATLK